VLGSVGVGYFIYGKKQGKPIPLVAGIILMVFPYFVSSLIGMIAIGILVILIPAVIKT